MTPATLAADELCVVEADVDELLRSVDAAALLSAEEAERADRFRDAASRRRFLAGRALARVRLGEALGVEPRRVEIRVPASGKPELAVAAAPRFSLAHSGTRVLLALCSSREVGADIEALRALPELLDLAKRFFAPEEHAALAALPEDERPRAFFSRWTQKEACLKALGAGLSGGLERTEFAPFTARAIAAAPGYVAAVAATGSAWTMRLERWHEPAAGPGA